MALKEVIVKAGLKVPANCVATSETASQLLTTTLSTDVKTQSIIVDDGLKTVEETTILAVQHVAQSLPPRRSSRISKGGGGVYGNVSRSKSIAVRTNRTASLRKKMPPVQLTTSRLSKAIANTATATVASLLSESHSIPPSPMPSPLKDGKCIISKKRDNSNLSKGDDEDEELTSSAKRTRIQCGIDSTVESDTPFSSKKRTREALIQQPLNLPSSDDVVQSSDAETRSCWNTGFLRHSSLSGPELERLTETYEVMMARERRYGIGFSLANDNHTQPEITERMRSILLDWLIEVCDENCLQRETYYLATDYVDRYLKMVPRVGKAVLQLLGVTCLYVAAKHEEIYPPPLHEMAYVTDGACSIEAILMMERQLLNTLQWNLNPVTPIAWLELFMQITVQPQLNRAGIANAHHMIQCAYAPKIFMCAARLLDVASLDAESPAVLASELAAAALFYALATTTASASARAYSVFLGSGLGRQDYAEAESILARYADIVHAPLPLPTGRRNKQELHRLQTHTNALEVMDCTTYRCLTDVGTKYDPRNS